ncbi:hypothetical protein [Paracoccus alkanivorans]|uniref:Uncharacterized protein n=1 Tax=Paracoccus alkanivorans TaxID=2116655 RepID=A0A3M0MD68_9RHOB|nr:hypothetical protein [Paracoccus alkanivorans]RMC35702.1 hypothetical protein C9E81_10875 [Paracoccus alkanivorans]
MDMIEPNLAALCIFVFLASAGSLGIFVLSGVFPLSTRPELTRPLGLGLIGVNTTLLLLVLGGTVAFGLGHLRWTSMVIAGGMAFLFTPGLFNIWPGKWRDGLAGLAIVTFGLGVSALILGASF